GVVEATPALLSSQHTDVASSAASTETPPSCPDTFGIASHNIVPFPVKRTYSTADAEALDGLTAQLRQYQNTLQMLQMRTKKLQKQLRDFDQAVQTVQRSQAKSG
ncbi:MAG: hypothetical protein ACK4RS_05010, partial [Thiothrix sp.]